MKFYLFALIALFASNYQVYAQGLNVPLPDYNEVVMVLKEDNTIASLDKSDIVTDSKQDLMRRYVVYMKAFKTGAAVSMKGDPTDRFVVSIQPGIDPDNVVELFKFDEITKDCRRILVASISGGWGKTKDIQLPKQQLDFKKVKDGSYVISPVSKLGIGEYVFIVNRPNISELGAGGKSIKGYCFSVK